jgi:hypothetical protein
LGRRAPCEGGVKRSGLASTRGPEAGGLLLLLARRRKMRREAEAEAEAGPGADGDSDGAARRQIRPDCGSRKRGMVVVANAMAVSCLPVWIFPSLVRSERGPIQSIGLVPARDPRRQPCIQHSAEQRTLRCGSIGALASGQKNSMRQWSAAAAASKAALPLRLARSHPALRLSRQGTKESTRTMVPSIPSLPVRCR